MGNWLQDFPYRMDLSLWIFVLAAVIAFVIAVITVSLQAYRAALANPATSLRYE
jgi:putative ABC transport system permease protein